MLKFLSKEVEFVSTTFVSLQTVTEALRNFTFRSSIACFPKKVHENIRIQNFLK